MLSSASLQQASLHNVGTRPVRRLCAGEWFSSSGAYFKLPLVQSRCRVAPVLEISASTIRCARAVQGAEQCLLSAREVYTIFRPKRPSGYCGFIKCCGSTRIPKAVIGSKISACILCASPEQHWLGRIIATTLNPRWRTTCAKHVSTSRDLPTRGRPTRVWPGQRVSR